MTQGAFYPIVSIAILLLFPVVIEEYCNCSLRQIMINWDNEEEAGMDLNGMPGYEVHRLLVAPCMQ